MNELKQRYFSGDLIPAQDFVMGGLVFFGECVWEDFRNDEAIGQYGLFDNDVYWRKLHPNLEVLITPKQKYLKRPPDTREGRRQADIERLDRSMERLNLEAIRAELAHYGKP